MSRNVDIDANVSEPLAFLSSGGETGLLIASMDWSSTALGAPATWGPELRSALSLCLTASVPMCVVWGPGRMQLYNDEYRMLYGREHPRLGQDFRQCWASLWPELAPPFSRCAEEQRPTSVENLRLFIESDAGAREAFFRFSFSPIHDVNGAVIGLFHVAIETTASVLSERRQGVLRALAARTRAPRSTAEALTLTAETLAAHDLDVPFILLYSAQAAKPVARLVAAVGLDERSPARPLELRWDAAEAVWPVTRALEASPVTVNDMQERLGPGQHGPYPEAPRTAVVMAITPCGSSRPEVVAVVGVSARLPLTKAYSDFHDLLEALIAAAVTKARVRELAERGAALAEVPGSVSAEVALPQALAQLDATNARLSAEIIERQRAESARTDLLRQLGTAQEDERRRIARDLHDSVGQLVTGLSLALKAALTTSQMSGAPAARLAEAQRVADALGREVHHLAVQLRPVSLDELGLEAAVQDLVSAWASRVGVRAECAITLGRARLTHEIETTLYRVVQEALTNVAKHARASVVSVVFTRVDGYVTAVVEDDGVGFDPEVISPERLGLLGMRERAGLVNGELDIESKPGWGTTVLVRIPIPDRHDEDTRQGDAGV